MAKKNSSSRAKKGPAALFSHVNKDADAGKSLPASGYEIEAKADKTNDDLTNVDLSYNMIDDLCTRKSQELSIELDALKIENKKLFDENNELTTKINEYIEEIDNHKAVAKKLSSMVDELSIKLETYDSLNDQLSNVKALKTRINVLENENKSISVLENTICNLKSSINKIKQQSQRKFGPTPRIDNSFTPMFNNSSGYQSWN